MEHNKVTEAKIQELFDHMMGNSPEEQAKTIFVKKYTTQGKRDEAYKAYKAVLASMLGDIESLGGMFGVIINDDYEIVGWDPINAMTLRGDGNVDVSITWNENAKKNGSDRIYCL